MPASAFNRRLPHAVERVLEIALTDVLVWEAVKAPRPSRAQVEVDLVELHTAEDVRRIAPDQLVANAGSFLARGDRGFAAVADGRFAGWVWLSRTSHRDPWSGLRIRLAPDEAYAYALWVDPEFRPLGVPRLLMSTMLAAVHADAALTRVYAWVDHENRESQMLLRLLGFKAVQSVRRVRLFDRIGRAVPRTDRPATGPLSRRGRHRTALAVPAPVNPVLQGDPL